MILGVAAAGVPAGHVESVHPTVHAYLHRLARTDPPLHTLARSLCLAPHATPAFVRRARLEFVPASAAGLEADLWFSPLVESADARAVVLDPVLAAGLRHSLAQDPAQWRAVHALTEEMQREAPELVRRYTRLAVADAGGPDADAELAGFAEAIAADAPDDASAEDVSRWLVHFLPRLPRVLAAGALARTLLISAATRLAVDPPKWVLDRHGPEGVAAARAAVRGHAELGVRLDDDGLILSRPPEHGSRVLEVPGAERVRIELAGPGADPTQGYPVEVGAAETVRVSVAVFADLTGFSVVEVPPTGGRPTGGEVAIGTSEVLLTDAEVVFGASEVLADGKLRAVLRRTGDGSELALRHGTMRRTVRLRGTPRLLRADERTGTVLLATEDELVVVRTDGSETAYFGGLGELRDTIVAAPHPSLPTPWVIVANEHGVCVVRPDAPADPPRYLSRSAEPGLRIWVGVESSELVIVSGSAEPQFIDLASGARMPTEAQADVLPATAITSGHGGRPLLYAQTGPRLVLMPTRDSTQVVRGGGLSSDIVSVAINRSGSRGASVDRQGRLVRWDGPMMSRPMYVVPLPFRAIDVSGADPRPFTVVGRGGPVELRDQAGRSMLLAPARRSEPDTGWLRDTLVATMPDGPAGDAALESLRRAGIDCARVAFPMVGTQPVHLGSDPASEFLRAARAAGIKVLAELPVGPAMDEIGPERAPGLLRRCAELLAAGADGVCVSLSPEGWGGATSTGRDDGSVDFLRSLRRLVDEHPGRVLVLDRGASGDSMSGARDACCHLVLAQESRSWREAAGLARGDEHVAPNWAVSLAARPDEDPARVRALASIALALPGLRAVAELPSGPASEAVAALLRTRGRERALTRGIVSWLGSPGPDVIALSRRYEGEFVVCVANLGPRRSAVALTTPSLPRGTLVDLLDLGAPRPVPPLGGKSPTMLTLAPDEYRWFRLLTTDELYAGRS
ncbi:hypothetical protein [Embleya sp. NPDC050493]|uniref:hypothetical protein n=1 Tax=Embleya sp. NPDC050493 TaxID=3363989 RepID=UPI0037981ECC